MVRLVRDQYIRFDEYIRSDKQHLFESQQKIQFYVIYCIVLTTDPENSGVQWSAVSGVARKTIISHTHTGKILKSMPRIGGGGGGG